MVSAVTKKRVRLPEAAATVLGRPSAHYDSCGLIFSSLGAKRANVRRTLDYTVFGQGGSVDACTKGDDTLFAKQNNVMDGIEPIDWSDDQNPDSDVASRRSPSESESDSPSENGSGDHTCTHHVNVVSDAMHQPSKEKVVDLTPVRSLARLAHLVGQVFAALDFNAPLPTAHQPSHHQKSAFNSPIIGSAHLNRGTRPRITGVCVPGANDPAVQDLVSSLRAAIRQHLRDQGRSAVWFLCGLIAMHPDCRVCHDQIDIQASLFVMYEALRPMDDPAATGIYVVYQSNWEAEFAEWPPRVACRQFRSLSMFRDHWRLWGASKQRFGQNRIVTQYQLKPKPSRKLQQALDSEITLTEDLVSSHPTSRLILFGGWLLISSTSLALCSQYYLLPLLVSSLSLTLAPWLLPIMTISVVMVYSLINFACYAYYSANAQTLQTRSPTGVASLGEFKAKVGHRIDLSQTGTQNKLGEKNGIGLDGTQEKAGGGLSDNSGYLR